MVSLEELLQLLVQRGGSDLHIASGSGYVRPLKVQRAGRAPMSPEELLRGFAIPKGTILA